MAYKAIRLNIAGTMKLACYADGTLPLIDPATLSVIKFVHDWSVRGVVRTCPGMTFGVGYNSNWDVFSCGGAAYSFMNYNVGGELKLVCSGGVLKWLGKFRAMPFVLNEGVEIVIEKLCTSESNFSPVGTYTKISYILNSPGTHVVEGSYVQVQVA